MIFPSSADPMPWRPLLPVLARMSLGLGLALGAKGATLAVLGLYVLITTIWAIMGDRVPQAAVMGGIGIAALIASGRHVLFVAQKRAAITAVLDRLDHVGLSHLLLATQKVGFCHCC